MRTGERRLTKNRGVRRLRIEPLESRRLMIVGPRSLAAPTGRGTGFDGVVGLDLSGFATETFNSTNCSGALLSTRRHILTAAHCVDDNGDRRADAGLTVTFDVEGAPAGRFLLMDVPASDITVNPNWNGTFDVGRGGDLALIELPEIAPFRAEGYEIYRGSEEVGAIYTMAGYGRTGSGSRGQTESNFGVSGTVRRTGKNIYDATAEILRGAPLREPATPSVGTALVSDFDNGNSQVDAMGRFYGLRDTGVTGGDSMEAQGDSGGPSFLGEPGNLQIIGVVSYGIDHEFNPNLVTDTNPEFVSFGELNVNTRVSAYAPWIDSVTRRRYDLVLDMQHQVEGKFDSTDDEIVATLQNGQFQIRVNGETVFEETTVSRIGSVRILGSQDDEVFRILVDDDVFRDKVTVSGRGGVNQIVFDGGGNSHPHSNPDDPLDVNADGDHTALDALLVINQLNLGGAELPGPGGEPPYLDVNADDALTALDALIVINALNEATTLTSLSTDFQFSDSAIAKLDFALHDGSTASGHTSAKVALFLFGVPNGEALWVTSQPHSQVPPFREDSHEFSGRVPFQETGEHADKRTACSKTANDAVYTVAGEDSRGGDTWTRLADYLAGEFSEELLVGFDSVGG